MKIMDLEPASYLRPDEQQLVSEICLEMGKQHLLEKNCVLLLNFGLKFPMDLMVS